MSNIGVLNESTGSIEDDACLSSLLSESNKTEKSHRSNDLRDNRILKHMSFEDNEMLV